MAFYLFISMARTPAGTMATLAWKGMKVYLIPALSEAKFTQVQMKVWALFLTFSHQTTESDIVSELMCGYKELKIHKLVLDNLHLSISHTHRKQRNGTHYLVWVTVAKC